MCALCYLRNMSVCCGRSTMGFLSDDILLDETTIAMKNVTINPLCNESSLALGHSSNPYIPAWYLQVLII